MVVEITFCHGHKNAFVIVSLQYVFAVNKFWYFIGQKLRKGLFAEKTG
jgi:hypothetical protein